MIRRITLENYMSHARTVIEPADGLTVLVGPNNCGKSAVVSALLSVCGETESNYMVRHGEKAASVTIETDDGHTIVWRRKKQSAAYVIDGVEVNRIGRGNVPDNLHAALRLPRIEARGEKFQVHFGLQKEPIFLLGDEKRTAAFFSSSAEAERLLEMQKLHAQKERQLKTQQRGVSADISRLTDELALLQPLDALADPVNQLEAQHAQLQLDEAGIDALERLIARLETAQEQVSRHAARRAASADLLAPPTMADAAAAERLVAALARWRSEAAIQSATLEATDSLTPPPAPVDPAPLQRLIHRMIGVRQDAAAWEARQVAAERLADPPTLANETSLTAACAQLARLLPIVDRETARIAAAGGLLESPVPVDARPMERTIDQLAAAQATAGGTAARVAATAALADPPALVDSSRLQDATARLTKAAADAARTAAAAEQSAAALAEVEKQIVAWATTHPICPTCGSAVDARHLIEGGHGHAA